MRFRQAWISAFAPEKVAQELEHRTERFTIKWRRNGVGRIIIVDHLGNRQMPVLIGTIQDTDRGTAITVRISLFTFFYWLLLLVFLVWSFCFCYTRITPMPIGMGFLWLLLIAVFAAGLVIHVRLMTKDMRSFIRTMESHKLRACVWSKSADG